jgi:hypothetical protein
MELVPAFGTPGGWHFVLVLPFLRPSAKHQSMQRLLPLLVFAFAGLAIAQPAKDDAMSTGLREAYHQHQKGDNEALTAKLRELLKLAEAAGAKSPGSLGHPDLPPDTQGTMSMGEETECARRCGIPTARRLTQTPYKSLQAHGL